MSETINLYDTRTMLAAVEDLKTPQTFLLDKFFPEMVEFDTKVVDVDTDNGVRIIANYVNRKAEGQNVEGQGYVTKSYTPPYVKPKKTSDVDKLLKRQPSEVIYANNKSALQRGAEEMGKDFAFLNDIITRAEELQASQALFDGAIQVKDLEGNLLEAEIVYGRSASHSVTLTGTDLWTNAASDPIANIRTWKKLIKKDSGMKPDICIMGSSVIDVFLDNTKVKAYLDNRSLSELAVIKLEDEASAFGAEYVGRIEGIDFYSYDEFYLDEANLDTAGDRTETPMVPINKILLGSTLARATRLYGAIEDIENPIASARAPKTWVENDPSKRFIQLHSAPLMVTHQPDAYVDAIVVA